MRSVPHGKQRITAGLKYESRASLSVVVVSSGPAPVAQSATQAVKSASGDLAVQLILVRRDADQSLARSVERCGGEFVVAPAGSSRAEMCDLGMSRVHGTIVAVRDDSAIGDASWLDTYREILTRGNSPAVAPRESVVMDTLMAGHAVRADSSEADASAASAPIGIVAAV